MRDSLRFPLTKDFMYLDILFEAVWGVYYAVAVTGLLTCVRKRKET